jgi:hypothetical protein
MDMNWTGVVCLDYRRSLRRWRFWKLENCNKFESQQVLKGFGFIMLLVAIKMIFSGAKA